MKDGQKTVFPSAINSTVGPLYVNSVLNGIDAFIFGTSHNSEEMEMAVRYWFDCKTPLYTSIEFLNSCPIATNSSMW